MWRTSGSRIQLPDRVGGLSDRDRTTSCSLRYSGNPEYVGACAVVPNVEPTGVLHPDKLIRGVVDKAKADPRWISAYVSIGHGRAEIEARLKTTCGTGRDLQVAN